MKILSNSATQTEKIGEMLATEILKKKRSRALVIALRGDLGGGKTTFLKGLAKGLGVKEKVLSPTFVILKEYSIDNKNFEKLYHFDCYRVEKKDIISLGFNDMNSNSSNIIAVEWSEKIEDIIPRSSLIINFKFIDEKSREIFFSIKE